MSVYVDNMRAKYGRMIMCHMIADNLHELHKMAYEIGVQRRWFQSHSALPHYDVCLSKRKLAIQNGAIEIGRRELAKTIQTARRRVGLE